MDIENNTDGPQRAETSRAATEKAVQYNEDREAMMKRLGENYKAIQMQMIGLEKDVQKGIEHVAQQDNPQLDELGIKLRAEMKEKIANLQIQKEEAEQAIREKGGEPSDYTVQ